MYPILLYLICSLFYYSVSFNVEVTLKQGTIIGKSQLTVFSDRLYFAFYAVPYAKPPIGKLRFKDPSPPKKWKRPYDATTEYYGACAQPHIVHKYALYGVEDCLYLNIYTPSLVNNINTAKAVIVWIHGHAFTSSFSHIYGPDFLIDNDLVVVTITHRIGVFGFLKLNDTDEHANMGLKDIVMSLKWIRKNIKQFGGDKTKITVMGNGSAATFWSLLLTTKYSHLFSKLILQSGSMFQASLFQNNYKLERDKLKTILQKKGIKTIRKASTKNIIVALTHIYNNLEILDSQVQLLPFLPIIESKSNTSVLTRHPKHYFNEVKDINKPILVGFNSQESIPEVIPFIQNPKYLSLLASNFLYIVPFANQCMFNKTSSTYKQVTEKIKRYYFKKGISEKYLANFLQYATDLFIYPIYYFIQSLLQLQSSNNIYVYKFNYYGNFSVVKANAMAGTRSRVKGVAAGDEICYIMKCEPTLDSYLKAKTVNNKDSIFIREITSLWANFAKTGDPTPVTYMGNVTWSPITLKDDNVLYLGKVLKMINSQKERNMFEFWNNIYRQYYERCAEHDEL